MNQQLNVLRRSEWQPNFRLAKKIIKNFDPDEIPRISIDKFSPLSRWLHKMAEYRRNIDDIGQSSGGHRRRYFRMICRHAFAVTQIF
ncbi:hypothetical protein PYH37_002518 [Sinorhizobium numidicum]|uniref:Uncharacterized protein n=1 Tax=Sinorhizobium numidicum TaxID=680248 RepID=A0ABY8D0E6_9HYPH|nr:hypothetical protein [Sinorhizobium numidicum]WEX77701.1 hypothetical protein PYH37_002518 [Sinorhizobium numidicum]WEX84361.1 hypothetical protein PYH38_003231 [Sinorhizobium numidicum]